MTKLSPRADGVRVLREYDAKRATPSLFDLITVEEASAAPEAEVA